MIASGYFGAIFCGRVILGAIADRIGVDRLVRVSLVAALIGAAIFAFGSPIQTSSAGLGLLGLGLSPIFPCLMARTPKRIGLEYAAHAVGFQVSAATIGAALIPTFAGILADRLGLEAITMLSVLLAGAIGALHELLLNQSGHSERLCRLPA